MFISQHYRDCVQRYLDVLSKIGVCREYHQTVRTETCIGTEFIDVYKTRNGNPVWVWIHRRDLKHIEGQDCTIWNFTTGSNVSDERPALPKHYYC